MKRGTDMTGSEQRLVEYMNGLQKRFVIPVYQRNYDWKWRTPSSFLTPLTRFSH